MSTNNAFINRTSVPKVAKTELPSADQVRSGSGMLMMACCVAMVAAFGFVIFTAPAGQSWGASALTALPLLACVGAHLIMHRFMGRFCHRSTARPEEISTVDSKEHIK